jgi:hypothetical protein
MSYNTAVFVENHPQCPLELLEKEDDGTVTYWDASHIMRVVERPEGQSVAEWYAAHTLAGTAA